MKISIALLVFFSACFPLVFPVSNLVAAQSQNQADPHTTKTHQPAKGATLVVDTDDACHLFIDDDDNGLITADASHRFTVGIGDHILKCKNDSIPDLVWRKVVEVKGSSQVAAVVSLKSLHIQYEQAVQKAQEAEATAAKQLAEAQAEKRQQDAAKAEIPTKVFETVKGTWGADLPKPQWCMNGLCLDSLPITYRLTFTELDTSRGVILFSMDWQDFDSVVQGGLLHNSVHTVVKGNRYKGYFTITPPDRLQGVALDCGQASWVDAKQNSHIDYHPCSSSAEGFPPGTVTIMSQDQLEFQYGDKRLLLTRMEPDRHDAKTQNQKPKYDAATIPLVQGNEIHEAVAKELSEAKPLEPGRQDADNEMQQWAEGSSKRNTNGGYDSNNTA